MPKPISLQNLIDSLGEVKAEMADLAEREADLRDSIQMEMERRHKTAAEGKHFRCTVSTYPVTTIDYKEVIAKLPKTPKLKSLLSSCSSTSERTTVKITSRTGELE